MTEVGAGIEAGAPALEPDLSRPLPRALRAFGFRDFRVFWIGSLLSSIGTNMQLAALAWVVAVATRSAIQVTALAFVTIFPLLILGPLGGSLADRLRRRRLLLSTQSLLMVQAFALWAVWELGYGHYWVLFGVSLAGGIVIALNTPAWQSIVPELVPRTHLQNAITLNSTQFNVSRAVGPMIAGLLIGTVGAGICFLINALSYVAVLGALVDAEAYGLLLGSFGIGAVGIALVIGTVDQRIVPSRLLGGGLLLTAIAIAGLGLSPGVVVGVVFMIGFGAAYVTVVAINHTAIQSLSGDHIRGRITSLWLMIYGICFPLGNLLMGVTADAFGVRAVLVTCGALVGVALVVLSLRRALTKIDTADFEHLIGESATAPAPP